MPPVGAHYTRTIALPVIGQQTVELSILSSTVARLYMKGAISLDEPVKYHPEKDGSLGFSLSDATLALLKRMHTSLRSAGCVPPGTLQAALRPLPSAGLTLSLSLPRLAPPTPMIPRPPGQVRCA